MKLAFSGLQSEPGGRTMQFHGTKKMMGIMARPHAAKAIDLLLEGGRSAQTAVMSALCGEVGYADT